MRQVILRPSAMTSQGIAGIVGTRAKVLRRNRPFHFPFSISHISFFIAVAARAINDK
jgi:hypothetical protein